MDKVGDILKSFLSFHNLEGGEKYVSLFSSWRKMAGDDIASHSRIIDLRKGALIVEVDHPGWAQVLQMNREKILETLAAAYPDLDIRMIHTRLAKEEQSSPQPLTPELYPESRTMASSEDKPSCPPESSEGEVFWEKPPLENIHDEELKKILLQLKKTLKEKNR